MHPKRVKELTQWHINSHHFLLPSWNEGCSREEQWFCHVPGLPYGKQNGLQEQGKVLGAGAGRWRPSPCAGTSTGHTESSSYLRSTGHWLSLNLYIQTALLPGNNKVKDQIILQINPNPIGWCEGSTFANTQGENLDSLLQAVLGIKHTMFCM